MPDFVYTRIFNGFSAPLDARAIALLERDPDVVGVYPVRAAYPASLSLTELLAPSSSRPAAGGAPELGCPASTARGVTIALLDTGVDATHPYLRGRLLDGIDILDPDGARTRAPASGRADPASSATGRSWPACSSARRAGRHRGVAPGASVLPIRVAGWQPNAEGGFAVYGRTDQLLAGLERAVDPNADGDAHDAARVALVGVAEPFAAFADGPRRARGRGRDCGSTRSSSPRPATTAPPGPATAASPAPAARPPRSPSAPPTCAARRRPCASSSGRACASCSTGSCRSAARSRRGRRSRWPSARPRRDVAPGPRGAPLARFFDDRGYSLVAGRAALLARAEGPPDDAREAAHAGAAAILVDGRVPAGALGLDERVDVPVVGVPPRPPRQLRAALARGDGRHASRSARRLAGQRDAARVDRAVLLARPRVRRRRQAGGRRAGRRARHRPSRAERRRHRALRDGQRHERGRGARRRAAAVLAQARPELDAAALKSVLVGTARPDPRSAGAAAGRGRRSTSAAATAAEVVAEPAAVAFGAADEAGWQAVRRIAVRNVSTRRSTWRGRRRSRGSPASR